MKNLFEYDYTLKAGDNFYLDHIIKGETYKRLFSQKYISFLNKGVCGNGGTTGFVNYALENDKGCLILVPNRSIVMSKENEYKDKKEVCCVYGGSGGFDRDTRIVIATYDQFPRLLKSLNNYGYTLTDDPWESKFWYGRTIIIDEYHKLVDESGFRETCHKVTELIKYTKCGVVLMSATPHWGYIDFIRELIDFRDILTYNIEYDQVRTKIIQIYETKKKDLASILKRMMEEPKNEHICVFYNNVKGIKDILDHIGGEECEVLCSVINKKELENYFSDKFNEKKRLHFLTSAYFTGQDIRHPIRQCIIIGSKEGDNMCLGERDIKQIIGRFRNGIDGIHIFYLGAKTQMNNYQPIKDEYDNNTQLLEVMGDNWKDKPASIHLKQDTIRLKDTLERFDYWSSKKQLIKRLQEYGYIVKDKVIGDFEGIEKRKKLSFKDAQKQIALGKTITYDDNKYATYIQEYVKEKGVEEMLRASRRIILDWYNIRKNVGITNLDLLSPEEKFKVLGLEHFGRYRGSFLMSCLKYLGVKYDYDQLSANMRENLGCFVTRWKADPKGKAAGDIYIVFVKLKNWEELSNKGKRIYFSDTKSHHHKISYQTGIKNKNRYGKTIELNKAPNKYNSLSNIQLYKWVNEDKEHRLPEVKESIEWSNLKKYKQTTISEMYRDIDEEYPHKKASMEYIDCLIVDIDNGITFSEFRERYKEYVWVAYPTINNIPDDWNKFRVIVPLKQRLQIVGEYNLMALKMLRSYFCYYEDQNHQIGSFINCEDWLKRKGNNGEYLDIPQAVVYDIMTSIKNSKELVMKRFDKEQADKNIEGFHRSKRTLDWGKDYFNASFSLGDGERHKRLFVIKNSMSNKDRDLFEDWLSKEYPKYLQNWKSHKIIKRS